MYKFSFEKAAQALLIFFLFFSSCKDENTKVTKSDQKEMTAVAVSADGQNFIVAKQSDEKTYKFTVPLGFDLQKLSKTKVVFTLSEGAYSAPASGSELNFTSVASIEIKVTAEDKSTAIYTIEKDVELSSDAKILLFALKIGNERFEGHVYADDGKVTLTVPYPLKDGLATAVPEFSISPSATVNPVSGVPQDFSKPVFYEVTSQDNTKKTWEIIVTLEEPSTENDIISFKLKMNQVDLDGKISERDHAVSIFVPDELSDYLKNNLPIIDVSPFATISPESGVPMIFVGESPYNFTYTVTAQDGVTQQEWQVEVTVEDPCDANPFPGCPNYEESEPTLADVITIGAVNYTVDATTVEKIDDGFWYLSAQVTDANKPLIIHSLRYTASMRGYSIESWIGRDSITGKEAPSTMVNRYALTGREVKVAINGGFYGTGNGEGPMGLEIMNGVTVFSPDHDAESLPMPIIGFDSRNRPYMDFYTTKSKVKIEKNGNEYNIASVNGSDPVYNTGGRWEDYLVLYNSYNGKRTRTNQWGTEALCSPVSSTWDNVSDFSNVRCRVEKIETGKGNMEIPKGKFVLSGNSKASTFLSTLQVGDYVNVSLNYSLENHPDVSFSSLDNIISGWNIILSNNEVQEYYRNEASLLSANHPRTSVGYSADGKYIFFTVVEGRNPTQASPTISAGVNTKELAQVMQYLGAANAINLDGGGSSCIMIDKETKNFCSDGSQRAVADGLAIIKK